MRCPATSHLERLYSSTSSSKGRLFPLPLPLTRPQHRIISLLLPWNFTTSPPRLVIVVIGHGLLVYEKSSYSYYWLWILNIIKTGRCSFAILIFLWAFAPTEHVNP